jgi:transcription antitermination protein NusB
VSDEQVPDRADPQPADEQPPAQPSAGVLAFEALYEHDVARHAPLAVLERLVQLQAPPREAAAIARQLVQGVLAMRAELDQEIQALAPTWPLANMSAIDRNILRLGLLELHQATNSARRRAALHAAVDLAGRYGGESSPRFVRGVLGRAAGARRPADPTGDPTPPGVNPGHSQAGGGER